MTEPLQRLSFLLGKWMGRAEDQFGEKGVIENTFTFTKDPTDHFIAGHGESWKEGKLVNRELSFLIFDSNIRKYVRKSIFSYGWINNEVGEWKDDGLLFDIVSIDSEPSFFKGVGWRSFLRSIRRMRSDWALKWPRRMSPFECTVRHAPDGHDVRDVDLGLDSLAQANGND